MSEKGSFLSAERGIVIAADVPSLDELRGLIDLIREVPDVRAVKVGFSLAIRFGLPAVVREVKEASRLPIIYDHQKAATDIPAMGEPFALACRDAGVESVIFFPQAGPRSLEGFVTAAFAHGITPIVGLTMTHEAYLQSEGGFIVDGAPELICQSAIKLGVTHYVLPGNKPALTRSFCEGILSAVGSASVLMPGIGVQGGDVPAAFDAAKRHHPFAIIGRAIYKSPDPRRALDQFAKGVRSWVRA